MKNSEDCAFKDAGDIFSSIFNYFGKGDVDCDDVLKSLNEFLLNFLTDNPIKTVGVP